MDEWLPKWFDKILLYLPADKKFLTGDEVTIYDMQVVGFLTNIFTNPIARDAAAWAPAWEKAPDRIKKYHADFCEAMKAYLDARPKNCTM